MIRILLRRPRSIQSQFRLCSFTFSSSGRERIHQDADSRKERMPELHPRSLLCHNPQQLINRTIAFDVCKRFSSSNSIHDVREDDDAVTPSRATPNGTSPRFYKEAMAAETISDAGIVEWVVKLDHRVLKTPAKKPVSVPSKALAVAVAAEWEWQEGKQIRPFTMPLMKLTATAIDQIPRDRDRVIQTLLRYFHTDTICCRAPSSLLSDKQTEVWDPLLQWVETLTGARPVASSELFVPDQPEEVVKGMETILRESNDWELAAIDSLAGSARSLIIGLAVARERIGVAEAMEAIRLEENFQVEEWGFVEGGHDIDVADLTVRISAASVFLRLLQLK